MHVELNSYEDIGAYLREVRESLGFDTRDIGQSLNIRAKYLTALEEGKIDVMPGKTYARGYLRNYAEYLGLDKEGISEAFDRLNSGGKMRYFVPEPTERNYQPGMLVVGMALVAVLGIYYYWYNSHHVTVPPDYQRVSPVPERLVDPVIDEPGMQENDDLFVGPYYRQSESLQGDRESRPEAAEAQKLPWLKEDAAR